jgi:hypothetical protein
MLRHGCPHHRVVVEARDPDRDRAAPGHEAAVDD